MLQKQCSCCMAIKAASEFYRDGRTGGFRAKCKPCHRADLKANPPRRTAAQKAGDRRRSGGVIKPYVTRAETRAQAEAKRMVRDEERARRAAEPKRLRKPTVGSKEWYETATVEQVTAYRRAAAAKSRARDRADPQKARARTKRYKREHPEVVSRHHAARWLRIVTFADGSVTQTSINKLIAAATDCGYCGTRLDPRHTMVDHRIPLAKNGKHRIDNLVVCCSTCNLSKGARTPWEWVASLAA